MSITTARARELMDRFPSVKILVVGDLMLDRYVHGRVERISPEAPVPVLHVTGERSVPGGACNVALNIQALGGRSRICGLTGACARADELLSHLQGAGIETTHVVRDARITTIVKTRIVADRQQVLRVDHENPEDEAVSRERSFLDSVLQAMQGVQGAVLEDYGKGCLHQEVVDVVRRASKANGIPVGYDPKDNHELDVRGITFATPNRREAFHVAGVRDRSQPADPLADPGLLEVGERLMRLWEPEHLMLTLGPQGMLLVDPDGQRTHVPTAAREVFDVSGAGDTVIATTLLAMTAGASFPEAAALANCAAGIVVGKLGTATCTPTEILDALERRS